MSLDKCEVVAFVATMKPDEARKFYCDVLGMKLEEDGPFAVVVSGANATIRIQKVRELKPAPYTALGWKVQDVRATAKDLTTRGVKFERFDGMPQDALGIWDSPSGAKVCWFKDPDGNVLSLTQFP